MLRGVQMSGKKEGSIRDYTVLNLPFHEIIFERISDGFFTLDEEMKYVHFNDRAEKLFGMKREDVTGKKIFEEVFLEAKGSIFEEKFRQALEKKEDLNFEVYFGVGSFAHWYDVNVVSLKDGIAVLLSVTTKEKETEKELEDAREKERFWASVVENAEVGVAVGYPDGSLGISNKAYQKITGYSHDELLKIDWKRELTPREWEDIESEKLKELHETLEPATYEKEYIRKDGTRIPVELIVHAKTDEKGKVVSYFSFISDISSRKNAEEEWKESELKYKTIVEGSIQGLVIAQSDPVRLSFVSKPMEIITGYSPEEMMKFGPLELNKLIHPDDRERFFSNFQKRLTGEKTDNRAEYRIIHKDGNSRWVELFSSLITYNGKPATQTVFVDITQRKRNAELLKNERKRFSMLLENFPGFIYLQAPDYSIKYANKYFKDTFGDYSKGPCYEIINYSKEPCEPCPTFEVFKNKEHKIWEWSDTNNEKEYLIYDYPFIDSDGSELVLEIGVEITQLKQAERKLKESEAKFRSYVDNTPDGVFITDENGRYVYVNPAASSITGYSREELLKLSIPDLLEESDPEESLRDFKVLKRKGSTKFEKGFVTKSGETRYWEGSGVKLSDKRFLGFFKDITDRKKTETELKEAQIFADKIAESTPAFLYIYDLDQQKNIWTNETHKEYFKKLVNYYPEMNYQNMAEVIHKDDFSRVVEETENLNRDPKVNRYSLDIRIKSADGDWKWMSLLNSVFKRDENGNILQIIGALFDISDRKKVEIALKESEEQFKTLFNKLVDPVFIHDINDGRVIAASQIACERYGYSQEEIVKLRPEDFNIDQKAKEVPDRIKKINSLGNYIFETIHKTKDGDRFPVEVHGDIIEYFGQEVILSLCRDISERKKAEKEIELNKTYLQNTIDGLTESVALLNVDGDILLTNRKWHEFAMENGAIESEVSVGINYFDACKDKNGKWFEEAKTFAENIEKLIHGDINSFKFEYPCHSPDKKRWFIGTISYFETEIQRFIVASHRDISERKVAELALRESEEFLNKTGEIARVGGWYLTEKFDKVYWTQTTGRIHELPDGYYPSLDEAFSYYHPDDQALVKECVENAIKKGKSFNFRTRLITAKGNQIWVQAIGHPEMVNGKCVRLSGTFQDITNEKEKETEIQKAKEEVEFYMDLLGHDLGNIHQGISGSLQLLNGRIETDDMVKRIINLANESVQNATELTREVVMLSKLRDREPEYIDIQLKEMIDEVKEQLTATFSKKNIEFITEKIENSSIRAEPIIKELFINILHNGIRLQNDNPWIKISAMKRSNMTIISIEDRGPGVPDRMKVELFKRFGQKGEKKRRGLGLSISRVLVERYNGTIRIEDRVQGDHTKGAKFVIELPAA
jgi:PAS domain S-box-containing protein